jgi:hypothetical protein
LWRKSNFHARRLLAQLEERADVVVLQAAPKRFLQTRECHAAGRRRDAEPFDPRAFRLLRRRSGRPNRRCQGVAQD